MSHQPSEPPVVPAIANDEFTTARNTSRVMQRLRKTIYAKFRAGVDKLDPKSVPAKHLRQLLDANAHGGQPPLAARLTARQQEDVLAATDDICAHIEELHDLRRLCLHEEPRACQAAFLVIGQLHDERLLTGSQTLNWFMGMIPNAQRVQLRAIGDALVRTLRQASPADCRFLLARPVHPFIALLQEPHVDVAYLVHQIGPLFRPAPARATPAAQLLRPLFFHVFARRQRIADTGALWTALLEQAVQVQPEDRAHSNQCLTLVADVLGWLQSDSADMQLHAVLLLIETIDSLTLAEELRDADDLAPDDCDPPAPGDLGELLSLCLLNTLVPHIQAGFDARPALRAIVNRLRKCPNTMRPYRNLLLMSLCALMPLLPDGHLACWCSAVLVLDTCAGPDGPFSPLALRMLLAVLLQCHAAHSMAPILSRSLRGVEQRFAARLAREQDERPADDGQTIVWPVRAKYAHRRLAALIEIGQHAGQLMRDPSTVRHFAFYAQRGRFTVVNELYFRALLLYEKQLTAGGELVVSEVLQDAVAAHATVADVVFMTWLYAALRETEPVRLLKLFRALPRFAGIAQHIPKIVCTLGQLGGSQGAPGALRALKLDLLLQVWLRDDRTFPFVRNALRDLDSDRNFEVMLAKAMTIRTICREQPSKYGKEMIPMISGILNHRPNDESGESARVIALETIVDLCESQTINIASVWTELRSLFEAETRVRLLVVQCRFYEQVPHFENPSVPYQKCKEHSLRALWTLVLTPATPERVSKAAMQALRQYDHTAMTTDALPYFMPQCECRPGEDVPTVVPLDGDFWPFVLGWRANERDLKAFERLVDLVHFYMCTELDSFRPHVFELAEGRPEPNNYNRLPNSRQSVLRGLVAALRIETDKPKRDDQCIKMLLATLIGPDTDVRPLPPQNWSFLGELIASDRKGTYGGQVLIMVAQQAKYSASARDLFERTFAEFSVASGFEVLITSSLFRVAGGVLKADTMRRWMRQEVALLVENKLTTIEGIDLMQEWWGAIDDQLSAGNASPGEPYALNAAHECYDIVIDGLREMYANGPKWGLHYAKFCEHVSPETVDRITGWRTDGTMDDRTFLRAMAVRACLCQTRGSLSWMHEPLAYVSRPDQILKRPQNVAAVGTAMLEVLDAGGESDVSAWAMEQLGHMQMLVDELRTARNERNVPALRRAFRFRLDMFAMAVALRSGYEALCGGAHHETFRLRVLAGALLHLFECVAEWPAIEVRIYEFFYSLLGDETFRKKFASDELLACFMQLFQCCRQRPYFADAPVWRRIIERICIKY